MKDALGPPAPRPCVTCPYRKDAPSGVWAPDEYEKLVRYDAPTGEQPPEVFACHQMDREAEHGRVCSGWVGCHGDDDLLALRIAVLEGSVTVEGMRAVIDYKSPVPLFDSGAEAAEHGLAEIESPSQRAVEAIAKIERIRSDLRWSVLE